MSFPPSPKSIRKLPCQFKLIRSPWGLWVALRLGWVVLLPVCGSPYTSHAQTDRVLRIQLGFQSAGFPKTTVGTEQNGPSGLSRLSKNSRVDFSSWNCSAKSIPKIFLDRERKLADISYQISVCKPQWGHERRYMKQDQAYDSAGSSGAVGP